MPRMNLPRLELHIPEPAARPGDRASFAHFDIPPAGVNGGRIPGQWGGVKAGH
jgi:hypothetical protein